MDKVVFDNNTYVVGILTTSTQFGLILLQIITVNQGFKNLIAFLLLHIYVIVPMWLRNIIILTSTRKRSKYDGDDDRILYSKRLKCL